MTTFDYITAKLAVDRTQHSLAQLYKSRSAKTEISDAITLLKIAHSAFERLIAEATPAERQACSLSWF